MRILLADAHALTREGLKRVALEIDAACEFVEAADAAVARAALCSALPLDAALFDVALFTHDEVSACRRDWPSLLLIALTASDDAAADVRWLAAGVNALVPKAAPTANLSAALRLALAGNVHVRGNGLSLAHPAAAVSERTAPGLRRGTGPLNLTARQYEVLGLVARRCSNKAIAAELGIGLRTVKGHVSVILRALHADNRADAGRTARRWLARSAPVRELPVLPA
jgi:DNA-binding NarL/FixJ family response regulator